MSTIGNPIGTSLLQTAQVQQTASQMRDRQKARTHDAAQRYRDLVDLQATAVEQTEAVRSLPHNESEQHEFEHTSHAFPEIPIGVDEADASNHEDNDNETSTSSDPPATNKANPYQAAENNDDGDTHIDFTA